MKNFGRAIAAIFAWALLCMALPAAAQIPTYNIYNDTNTVLNFQTFDPGRGTWKDQQVGPHQQKTFNMNSGIPTGKIRIATADRGFNEYNIGAGGVYRLTWSQAKQMWDVSADQQGVGGRPKQPYGQANPVPGGNGMPYSQGDATMVLWKGKWYPATVIQVGRERVKIHYDGYDNSWDEWVDGSRIRPR